MGIAAGLSGAVALARFASSMLFATPPHDPLTIASVAGLLLLISALTASPLPARRAARIDPAVTLRVD